MNEKIKSVDSYPFQLRDALDYLVENASSTPKCVVLTPGPFNSAYFEHSFLAQQLGAELVIGDDLVVFDDRVWMRTTAGFERGESHRRRRGRRAGKSRGSAAQGRASEHV